MPHTGAFGTLVFSDDPGRLDLDAVHAMLVNAYWCRGIPRALVERAIANSIAFGAYDGARQVAFARVISDRATFAYLCDVIVAEDVRGRGIGEELVRFILAHPDLQGLRRWCLLTLDAQSLYEKFGFAPIEDPRRYMEIARRNLYAAPPAAP